MCRLRNITGADMLYKHQYDSQVSKLNLKYKKEKNINENNNLPLNVSFKKPRQEKTDII